MANKKTLFERLAHWEPGLTWGQWAYDRISNNWALLAALFSGGGMSYLASISQWIEPFGPLGWGVAGLASALVVYLIMSWGYWLYARARGARLITRFQERTLSNALINPLDRTFTGKRIRISDLAPPVAGPIQGKVFVDCEIIGPGNVIFSSCAMNNNGGEAVDGLIVREGLAPHNGFLFMNCSFTGCRFYLLTFMVPERLYKEFSSYNWNGVNWLTDTPEPMLPFNQAVPPAVPTPQSTEPET